MKEIYTRQEVVDMLNQLLVHVQWYGCRSAVQLITNLITKVSRNDG